MMTNLDAGDAHPVPAGGVFAPTGPTAPPDPVYPSVAT